MFYSLPSDLILMILYNCTHIYDVINLSLIDKTTYNMLDDIFYMYWGRNLYSNEFWNKAKKRNPITYKPYINMKIELLRIQIFQDNLKKNGLEKWNNDDFYKYWDALENYVLNRGTHHIPPIREGMVLNRDIRKESFNNEEIYKILNIL